MREEGIKQWVLKRNCRAQWNCNFDEKSSKIFLKDLKFQEFPEFPAVWQPWQKKQKKKKIQKMTENKLTNMKVRLSWLDNKGEASIKIK